MALKFISWNINAGKNVSECIQFLRAQQPDGIALQEVVEGHTNANGRNVAQVIAEQVFDPMSSIFYIYWASAFHTDRHFPPYEYGNAFISRFPIIKGKTHFLSTLDAYKGTRETEPRNAIEMILDVGGGQQLCVIDTHLAASGDLGPFELRHRQVDILSNAIQEAKRSTPIICLGDFNASHDAYVMDRMNALLHNADEYPVQGTWPVTIESAHHHAEFSAGHPPEFELLSQRIDHVFVSDHVIVRKFEIGETKASDHLPLIVEIEL